jgi:excinuclease ABC subunit B
MQATISETERRRKIQSDYNEAHGIVPKSVTKGVRDVIEATKAAEEEAAYHGRKPAEMSARELKAYVAKLEEEMRQAAKDLQFERAAELRDMIFEYKVRLK